MSGTLIPGPNCGRFTLWRFIVSNLGSVQSAMNIKIFTRRIKGLKTGKPNRLKLGDQRKWTALKSKSGGANLIVFFTESIVAEYTYILSISVLNQFTNARFSKSFSGTFVTIFVLLADAVKSVHGWSISWITHWSISKYVTVTAICPVFSFVEIDIVIFHEFFELDISSILFDLSCWEWSRGANNFSIWQHQGTGQNFWERHLKHI